MILFWVLAILGVVFVVRLVLKTGRSTPDQLAESPLDILKKSYARGEISREDYERMKRELE